MTGSLAAIILGAALAIVALAFVLWPLFAGAAKRSVQPAVIDAAEAEILRYRRLGSSCPACGPRPEPDARYCSNCGRELAGPRTEA